MLNFISKPTIVIAITEKIKFNTVNAKPLGIPLRRYFIFVFKAPSKRMKTRAKFVKKFVKGEKKSFVKPTKEDIIIPKITSHITSGIFVFLNIRSPKKPRKIIAPKIMKTKNNSILAPFVNY